MDNLEPITRNEMFLNGDDLEPITREEMILAGADLEPITRHEWFLKKYRGGGGGGEYDLVNIPNLPADIASFNDGTDLPMASLKVAVTPYQDLHGYDAPWAGGAGKNKLNNIASSKTENNVTFTVNSDGSVKVYSTGATATTVLVLTDTNNPLIIQANKSYILSGCPNGGSYSTYELMLIATPTSGSALLHDYGSGVTIESSESDRVLGVQIVIRSGQVINDTFYPMVRLATETNPTFAPYSNICPIIGWDEAVVNVTGINIWDEEWVLTGINANTGAVGTWTDRLASKNYILAKPSTSYYFQAPSTTWYPHCYDKDKNWLGRATTSNGQGYIEAHGIFTTLPNTAYIKFSAANNLYGTTYNNNISINYPSTDTEYHAYNGATYTIDLDGTRYGGVVDATNGTMDDTLDYIASYNGEALPSTWISDRDVYAEGTTPTIGAEVVYTRATPITVQLAPTQVKSLEGENNISANCGQITEVKYFKKA